MTSINMELTGLKIKSYVKKQGYSVKDIQEYLCLACPQPIYRWFKGKILPSIDNLLRLSELFNVHMEDLLVKNDIVVFSGAYENTNDLEKFVGRMLHYAKLLSNMNIGLSVQ